MRACGSRPGSSPARRLRRGADRTGPARLDCESKHGRVATAVSSTCADDPTAHHSHITRPRVERHLERRVRGGRQPPRTRESNQVFTHREPLAGPSVRTNVSPPSAGRGVARSVPRAWTLYRRDRRWTTPKCVKSFAREGELLTYFFGTNAWSKIVLSNPGAVCPSVAYR